jgi:L-alanine-DL-glutamate epimerase-like enolase superfamily enzyme
MLIRSIQCSAVRLPFRFSFGHALASRNFSINIIVKAVVVLDDGRQVTGWGEAVPRQYVTGETPETALAAINYGYAPRLSGKYFSSGAELLGALATVFEHYNLFEKPAGASFCAVELALLDALAQVEEISFSQLPARIAAQKIDGYHFDARNFEPAETMTYGGVVPFGKKAILQLILAFYKRYGFKTVKLKVGGSLTDDVARVKLARQVLGDDAILRVDANCAWSLEQAKWSLAALRPFNIASCEQPLVADDIAGLAELTASVPEKIMVDESLTTLAQAENLIERKSCNAFNIRLSKVGGLVASMKMIELARANGIECHLGAQVGESGILVAAQRHLALAYPHFANVEGAMNLFLLKSDLVRESMTVPPGAIARAPGLTNRPVKHGLGVTVSEGALASLTASAMMKEVNHAAR